ncbi:hypothetical protein CHS0354_027711, partial [Potamilus streckersoni]
MVFLHLCHEKLADMKQTGVQSNLKLGESRESSYETAVLRSEDENRFKIPKIKNRKLP